MVDWKAPEEIVKEVSIIDLDDDVLNRYHDQMHIFWDKIKEGYWFGWNFKEVYLMHKALVIEMMRRGIGHIHPVNDLDNVSFAASVEELTEIINRINTGELTSN